MDKQTHKPTDTHVHVHTGKQRLKQTDTHTEHVTLQLLRPQGAESQSQSRRETRCLHRTSKRWLLLSRMRSNTLPATSAQVYTTSPNLTRWGYNTSKRHLGGQTVIIITQECQHGRALAIARCRVFRPFVRKHSQHVSSVRAASWKFVVVF